MTDKLETFFTSQGLKPVGSLAHWGIKGMKWGIRRSDEELARASSDSADAIRARETLAAIQSKGSLSAASDADLNHLVNRINLEKRYAEVNPSGFERGHAQIKTVLKVGQTMNEAVRFANSPAGRLLASSLGLSKSSGKHAKPVSLSSVSRKKKK
jgi:hypothetical protein